MYVHISSWQPRQSTHESDERGTWMNAATCNMNTEGGNVLQQMSKTSIHVGDWCAD